MATNFKPNELPQPLGYGYVNGTELPQTNVRLPRPETPQMPRLEVPDSVRAMYGSGDRDMVGALLKTANGEEGGLVGITPTFAARILTGFGYPTTEDAWNYDQWKAAIEGNAMKLNPADIIDSFNQIMDSNRQGGY